MSTGKKVSVPNYFSSIGLTLCCEVPGLAQRFGSRVAGNEPKRGQVSHIPKDSWGNRVHCWPIGSGWVSWWRWICNLEDGHAQVSVISGLAAFSAISMLSTCADDFSEPPLA
jgi:hypothetical protein